MRARYAAVWGRCSKWSLALLHQHSLLLLLVVVEPACQSG
jgi:hypothetical protein